MLLNTCYSLAAPDYGFSITAAFRAGSGALETLAGSAGTSPLLADRELRRQEARHASAWYDTATRSMFGTAGGNEA